MKIFQFVFIVVAGMGLLSACRPGPVDPPFNRDHIRPEISPEKYVLKLEHYLLVKTGAVSLWQKTSGQDEKGNRTVVAVIGTGIDYTNPDLRDSLWTNSGEMGEKAWINGYDDDGNGYDDDVIGYDFYSGDGSPYDWHGHDTYTSAIIGASGRKNANVLGMAPNAALMVLRYLGPDGRGQAMDAYLAFDYAMSNGAKIIYFNWPNQGFGLGGDQLVVEAIAQAGERNVLVILPAGNDANQDVSPFIRNPRLQAMEHVLIVAGLNKDSELSDTTNYGKRLAALAAPSEGVRSYFPGHQEVEGALATSSVAAAYVTGAAALVASLPGMGAASDMRKALLEAAFVPEGGRLEVLSGGYLDLKNFVNP